MKILHKFLLGASLLAVCACSQSEILTEGGDPGNSTDTPAAGQTRELVLEINNTLQITGGQTKAPIATEAENQITSMDIYLFGSKEEEGTYTFLEHLAYRSNLSQVEGATPFELIPNAQNTAVSNAILNVTKGLYVKLYCVANQPDLFMRPAEADAYPDASFSKLTLDTESSEVQITKTGTPSEATFRNNYLLRVLTTQAEPLNIPLPMVGNVPGPIDLTNMEESSRLQTNLKLTRAVARFDIVNTAAESNLTINAVGLEGGYATTSMFPMVGQNDPKGEKISYPERSFADGDAINTGGQLSAYYSYAAPDNACLVLKGKYTTPGSEAVNVTYKVPFNGIKNQEGVNVAIQPNHRYTVTVNEADPYEIKLTIEVLDWEEGGSLDEYDPSEANDLKFSAISLTGDVNGNVNNLLHTVNTASAGTKGSLKFQSNSAVTVSISYAGGDMAHKWLTFAEPAETNLAVGNQYSKEYTFTPTVTAMADFCYPPATVVFSNAAGSLKVLTIHSLNLATSASNSQTAYLINPGGDKKFLMVKSPVNLDNNVNWTTAMAACPEEEGWRLPTLNDMRQLLLVYNYDDSSYLTPGTQAYMDAFDNKTYTYNANPTTALQYKFNTVLTNANYFYYNYNYWASDIDPDNGNQAGYLYSYSNGSNARFTFAAKTSTYRVRCIKDWK